MNKVECCIVSSGSQMCSDDGMCGPQAHARQKLANQHPTHCPCLGKGSGRPLPTRHMRELVSASERACRMSNGISMQGIQYHTETHTSTRTAGRRAGLGARWEECDYGSGEA
jgi:hypothetical protein